MALKIRSMKDFSAGLMLMGIGGLFRDRREPISNGHRGPHGPGLFPSILGWGTVALGLFVFIESFIVEDTAPTPTAWRPLILVIGAVCAFAALINTGGLITATVVLIIVICAGRPRVQVERSDHFGDVFVDNGVADFRQGPRPAVQAFPLVVSD